MENINKLNDSDIELIEHEQTIISIPESEDVGMLQNDNTSVAFEEGEVIDELPQTVDANSLLFEVKFQNNDFFQRNGVCIANALEKACAAVNDPVYCNLSTQELNISVYSTQSSHVQMAKIQPQASKSKESSPDLTGIKELFTIDPSPSDKPEIVQVPSYKRSIKNVLDEESFESKRQKSEDSCQRVRNPNACFNCGDSGHPLRDCPKKRNGKRIQQARNRYMTTAESRYHVKVEDQYPHLRPGVISETLRRALGMRTGEVPFFYYRMRVLGYPPGWLEDAKVQPSGLGLISGDGSKVSIENNSKTNENDNVEKFDVSKIIEFPGFNVQPNAKFYDDYKHHNVPPLQQDHMKEEFIKRLGSNVVKGYKRRKISNFPQNADDNNIDEIACLEPTDMEIEDDHESMVPTPNMNKENNVNNPNDTSTRTPSPTLADLEAKQNALLQALERGGNTSLSITNNDEKEAILTNEHNATAINDITAECVEMRTPKAEVTTPIIKESHMGTPLLKFSPFDKLPSGDNFKVGVSDVINFENLPDSTGKYEQMKLVIKKVRNIVTQLNSEEADD